jgi:hypothetical protein
MHEQPRPPFFCRNRSIHNIVGKHRLSDLAAVVRYKMSMHGWLSGVEIRMEPPNWRPAADRFAQPRVHRCRVHNTSETN